MLASFIDRCLSDMVKLLLLSLVFSVVSGMGGEFWLHQVQVVNHGPIREQLLDETFAGE